MSSFVANTKNEVQEMLKVIGAKSIDDLFLDIHSRHQPKSFNIPNGLSEFEVLERIRSIASKNDARLVSFLGAGFYDHYVPEAVSALTSRAEFYTAYTPYQPESSQGILQALYEYQSMIATLTNMDVVNASLYDGGTALYEAMMMAIRINGRKKILMDGGVSPIYRKIIRSYTSNFDIEFKEMPVVHGRADREAIKNILDDKTSAIILQNPNFFGAIDDHSDIIKEAHSRGILVIESVYPISLGILKTPGEMDADIVTGEGQSLGLSLNFGGPYLGFIATKRKYVRKMPGRIVGQTEDKYGQRCFVNTLQAREQHIRREKATSNICTNVALCAVQAAIFMSLLGKQGLKDLAQLNFEKAEFARKTLGEIKGVEVKRSSPTFNEFVVCLPKKAKDVVEEMIKKGFASGFPLAKYYPEMENYLLVAVTEKRTKDEIVSFAKNLEGVLCS
ncbi:MAG: aminomethyl-transferring glycine dehydrogenase subunit GcvPA [Candidatus Omnitrophica bacterium]|nr:aminomethyl-transferring glycine dehydrogenase subunit GcvPA [Candidatus Omnitrophota bacterium]